MKERIDRLFLLLDKHLIRYYLLRPLDFTDKIKDIDMVLCKQDYSIFKEVLISNYISLKYKPPNANSSLQLLVDDLLLDIKFDICFLPRKSLMIKEAPPYASVKYIKNTILVPNVTEDVLFTFWTYHLFLDKSIPLNSNTFQVYQNFYKETWKIHFASDFFTKWTVLIFNKRKSQVAKNLLERFFADGFRSNDEATGRRLKSLVLDKNLRLQMKYCYDKVIFGIYRRLGRYENYRTIK